MQTKTERGWGSGVITCGDRTHGGLLWPKKDVEAALQGIKERVVRKEGR